MKTPVHHTLIKLWMVPIFILVFVVGLSFVIPQEDPLKVSKEYEVVPNPAAPGDTITIQRELDISNAISRNCSASVTKWIEDSNGTLHFLGSSERSDADFERFERNDPGRVILTLTLPTAVSPGPALYVAKFKFHCNIFHYINPIEVTLQSVFTVEPLPRALIKEEIQIIREELDSKTDDRYRGSDARRDWKKAREQFEAIQRQIEGIRKRLERIEQNSGIDIE